MHTTQRGISVISRSSTGTAGRICYWDGRENLPKLLKRGDKHIQQFIVSHSSRALSAPGTSSVMTCTYTPTNSDKVDERRVTAR